MNSTKTTYRQFNFREKNAAVAQEEEENHKSKKSNENSPFTAEEVEVDRFPKSNWVRLRGLSLISNPIKTNKKKTSGIY